MTVTTTKRERASVEVPNEVLARFLRSLGFPVKEDTNFSVYQPRYGEQTVQICWDLDETTQTHEVEGMRLEDIEFAMGMAELAQKAEDSDG